MGGAAPDVTRRRALAGAALVVATASVAAWALVYPQSSLTVTLLRAVADCAAVISLGLAVVPLLDGERYRSELITRATAPLTATAAVWLVAELGRLIVAAAQAAAVAVPRVGVHTTVDFAVDTAAGRAGLLGVGAAAAVCVATAVAPRTVPVNLVVAGLAAVGVTARVVTGHFFESALGGLGVAVHTLAAALWCGTLAALVLTVEHRGQWARVLPRFSQLSVWCVLTLLIGGTVGAVEGSIRSPSCMPPATGDCCRRRSRWRWCWCCWAGETARCGCPPHAPIAPPPWCPDRARSPNWR